MARASSASFPLHSPQIWEVEVVRKGIVRRAKLYYLRVLRGKAARIVEDTEAQREMLAEQVATGYQRREKIKKGTPGRREGQHPRRQGRRQEVVPHSLPPLAGEGGARSATDGGGWCDDSSLRDWPRCPHPHPPFWAPSPARRGKVVVMYPS